MYKERKDKTPDKSAATAKKALNKIVRGFFREKKMIRESSARVNKRTVRRALVGMYGETPRGDV